MKKDDKYDFFDEIYSNIKSRSDILKIKPKLFHNKEKQIDAIRIEDKKNIDHSDDILNRISNDTILDRDSDILNNIYNNKNLDNTKSNFKNNINYIYKNYFLKYGMSIIMFVIFFIALLNIISMIPLRKIHDDIKLNLEKNGFSISDNKISVFNVFKMSIELENIDFVSKNNISQEISVDSYFKNIYYNPFFKSISIYSGDTTIRDVKFDGDKNIIEYFVDIFAKFKVNNIRFHDHLLFINIYRFKDDEKNLIPIKINGYFNNKNQYNLKFEFKDEVFYIKGSRDKIVNFDKLSIKSRFFTLKYQNDNFSNLPNVKTGKLNIKAKSKDLFNFITSYRFDNIFYNFDSDSSIDFSADIFRSGMSNYYNFNFDNNQLKAVVSFSKSLSDLKASIDFKNIKLFNNKNLNLATLDQVNIVKYIKGFLTNDYFFKTYDIDFKLDNLTLDNKNIVRLLDFTLTENGLKNISGTLFDDNIKIFSQNKLSSAEKILVPNSLKEKTIFFNFINVSFYYDILSSLFYKKPLNFQKNDKSYENFAYLNYDFDLNDFLLKILQFLKNNSELLSRFDLSVSSIYKKIKMNFDSYKSDISKIISFEDFKYYYIPFIDFDSKILNTDNYIKQNSLSSVFNSKLFFIGNYDVNISFLDSYIDDIKINKMNLKFSYSENSFSYDNFSILTEKNDLTMKFNLATNVNEAQSLNLDISSNKIDYDEIKSILYKYFQKDFKLDFKKIINIPSFYGFDGNINIALNNKNSSFSLFSILENGFADIKELKYSANKDKIVANGFFDLRSKPNFNFNIVGYFDLNNFFTNYIDLKDSSVDGSVLFDGKISSSGGFSVKDFINGLKGDIDVNIKNLFLHQFNLVKLSNEFINADNYESVDIEKILYENNNDMFFDDAKGSISFSDNLITTNNIKAKTEGASMKIDFEYDLFKKYLNNFSSEFMILGINPNSENDLDRFVSLPVFYKSKGNFSDKNDYASKFYLDRLKEYKIQMIKFDK